MKRNGDLFIDEVLEKNENLRATFAGPSRMPGEWPFPGIFDSINHVVYLADPKTYEVIYVNDYAKTLLGADPVGKKCFSEFQGLDAPCDFCTNEILFSQKEKPYCWEYYNPKIGASFSIFDRLIPWYEGCHIRFELAVNMNEIRPASRKWYRDIVDMIGTGVSVVSPRMEILALNRQMREWFPNVDSNRKPTCFQAYKAPLGKKTNARFPTYRALRDGKAHEAVSEIPVSGEIRSYRIKSSPVMDCENNVIAAVETVEDITEEIRAMKTKDARLERANRILEAVRNIKRIIFREKKVTPLLLGICNVFIDICKYSYAWIILVDEAGVLRESVEARSDNPGLLAEIEQLKNEKLISFIRKGLGGPNSAGARKQLGRNPDVKSSGFDIITARLECEARVYGLLTIYGPNVFDPDAGRLITETAEDVAYALHHINLDEQRREAQKEHARLAEAIGQSADCVMIINVDGTIRYTNPAFERIFEYSRDEITGKDYRLFHSAEHGEAFHRKLWVTLEKGDIWKGRIVNLSKGGRRFELESTISPVRDREGNVFNYVWVGRDITHEVELEKRLRRAQKMESIGTLAGGIAHDFNNILSSIMANTEIALIHELPENSPARYSLEQVIQASYRAMELIRQIHAFGRQSEQGLKPIKVMPIIKEALKLLRASLPSTIEIRLDFIAETDTIWGDFTQIHQILMNLCANAAYAMREKGGVLTVSLLEEEIESRNGNFLWPEAHPGNYLKLAVKDTGHGMRPSVLERIFDPYFTTKPQEEGTGLGLSVVHGIVENHGGMIAVESAPGKGSVFFVYFPKVVVETRPENKICDSIPRGNEHILLVDDEVMLTNIYTRTLESLGYTVTACADGIEALGLFRKQPQRYDLVITDIVMPGLTGEKLAGEIMRVRPDIPVVFCTGQFDTEMREIAAKMGIGEFLAKPVIESELALAIRRALGDGAQD